MPKTVVQQEGVVFETSTPSVFNSANRLTIAMPVLNTGTAAAVNVTLTSVTLGSATRVEPALPFVLGSVASKGMVAVDASFLSGGLAVGSRLMLTVRGTYQLGGATLGFTLNRPIIVPAPGPPPIPTLAARVQVEVNQAAGTWSFMLFNDEPVGSPRYLADFSLDMTTPFTVTGTPPGWAVDTDNASYVLWFAVDTALPYPNHVAPGASRGGFRIQSARRTSEGKRYGITSWNHQTDRADLVAVGTTLVPARG